MIRIGIVTQSYDPVRGGVGEHVHHLALGLLARGHAVTVLTGGAEPRCHQAGPDSPYGGAIAAPRADCVREANPVPRSADSAGVAASAAEELAFAGGELLRVGRTRRVRFQGATVTLVSGPDLLRGLGRVGRDAFDLLHVHSPLEPFLPFAALTRFAAPALGTFHSAGMASWGYLPFLPLLRPLAARLVGRIAVSQAARDHVAGYFPGDYRIIPNGVDPGRFVPRVERSPGPLRVLAVGRLDPRKGLGTLLEALAPLHSDPFVPAFELRILGDGPERTRLERQALALALPVRFLGAVDECTKRKEYAEADLFAAPATHGESFGIVLLEALAAGLPVVASAIPGYREVLDGSGAARLVAPAQPAAWSAALRGLLTDPGTRTACGSRARDHASRYTWGPLVAQIEALYGEVLQRAGRRCRGRADHSTVQVVPARRRAWRSP